MINDCSRNRSHPSITSSISTIQGLPGLSRYGSGQRGNTATASAAIKLDRHRQF